MKHITILLFALAPAVLSACSTASKPASDLDVTPGAGPQPEPGAAAALPEDAVTNWQAFFKAPPNKKQQNQLEQKLAKWPDSGDAAGLLAKGRTEVVLGRYAAAEATFRQVLRSHPDNRDAALELAVLFLRRKDVQKAMDMLTQVRDTIQTDDATPRGFIFRYRYVLAQAYLGRGDRVKAHKVLSDLIAADKSFAPAYTALARSYLALGKDSVAEFVVRRGLDRIKDDPNLLTLMGVLAAKERRGDAARNWYERALAANPKFAPALINRAALSLQMLEYGPAEEDLLLALAQDPMNADALVTLGIVQRRQGNIAGARSSFSKAIDVDPGNATARFNLGVLLADDARKPAEAMRLFSEVLQTPAADREIKEIAQNYLNDLRQSGTQY